MSRKTCNYLFFLISFLFIFFGMNTAVCQAIPALPESFDVSQPTGQTFQANQNGDEWQNWITKSDDQSVIVQDEDGYWKYAKISYGELEATDARVGIDPAPSSQLKSSDWSDNINNFTETSVIPKTYYADGSAPSASSVPLQPAGTSQKILVLLVSFSNKTIQNTDAVWNDKFFGSSGQTVNNFYKENSGGTFSFSPASESFGTSNDGIVKVTLNYSHPNTAGNTDDKNRNIVKDALIAADPYINFSSYDVNGNGYIDLNEVHIVTITAGYEASCGSASPSVWGHRWALGWSVPAPQLDGKFVAQSPYGGYTQQGEIHATMGDHIATVGILCHELGHDLGLFDEYNTTNSLDLSVGASSLMASGSWGMAPTDYPGGSPAHMDPWSKIFLGFTTPLDVSEGIHTVKSASTGQYNVLKIATSDANQYFLVENRNTSGFDVGLYYDSIMNGGTAIWHVDESVITANMASNTVNNNPAHRGVDIERAVPDIKPVPYYRSGGPNDTFSDTTTPNSKLYSGTSTNVSIKTLDPTGTSMRVLLGNLTGVQFSSATYSVAENTGSIDLTVNRTGSTSGTLTVDYTTSDGTATAGSDYTTTSGTLTFADGEASKTVTVTLLDDAVYEGNETLMVTLSNVSAGNIVIPTATVTIADNELVPVKIYLDTVELTFLGERTNIDTNLYYDYKVTRTGSTSGILTVDYFTTDITATSGVDYLPLSGTLTFADGEAQKILRATAIWDGELEDTETFKLGLRNASSGVIVSGSSNIIIEDLDIAFNSLNYTVQENSGNIILTVNRGLSNRNTAASFKYTTVDGTAKAGIDYTAGSGTVLFAAGQMSKTITILIRDDTVYEGDETFTVKLTDVNLTEIKNPIATITIRDNEIPKAQIGFNPSSYTVAENNGSASLTVTRSIVTTGTLSFKYTTTNGTASAGNDYSASSGTLLTFADGETSKTITVPILDDSVYEGNETFTVTLSNPSTGTIVIPVATVTIADNEPMPTHISISPTGMTFGGEGNGTSAYRDFTVTRSGNTSGTLTVDYSTSDITATAGIDYLPLSGTLTFANGELQKTIRVNILWDGELEVTESFELGLHNASSGVIDNATATIYINDVDIALDSLNYTIEEDSGNVILTVNRGLSHSGLISSFSYTTIDGTAKAGIDYAAGSGTVTFAPGEMSKSITIPILDDAVYEGDETFTVKLTDVLMTQTKNPIATVTIHDNDTISAQIGFNPSSYIADENSGSASLTVTRSDVITGTLAVDYSTANGTALAGNDYSSASGTLTFADGETSKTITVPVLDDAIYEGNEAFTVTLSNPSTGTITTPTATVTVVENDPSPQISFSPTSYSVAEDGLSVTMAVYRSVNTTGIVSMNYVTVNGTAVAGSDFTSASGTLSFADGETYKTITVNITDDAVHELDEAFKVRLSNPVGGTIITQDANITITDNDTLAPSGDIVKMKPYVPAGTTIGICNVGTTQQLTILATFENGGTMDITALAVWASEYTDVATVNGGLITGIKAGITKISFTYGGQTFQFLYTIKP